MKAAELVSSSARHMASMSGSKQTSPSLSHWSPCILRTPSLCPDVTAASPVCLYFLRQRGSDTQKPLYITREEPGAPNKQSMPSGLRKQRGGPVQRSEGQGSN